MAVKRKQYCDGDSCGKGAASMRLTQSSPCSLCTTDCRTLATHVAKIRDYCRTLQAPSWKSECSRIGAAYLIFFRLHT